MTVRSDPFFFFNDTATTEIYTLSLHDALPISGPPIALVERVYGHLLDLGVSLAREGLPVVLDARYARRGLRSALIADRKSTRLNSSHANISYAVFCLKKKKKLPYCGTYCVRQI